MSELQIRELREKKAKVWDGCRAIMEKLESGIELTAEDRKDFDKRNKKITEIDDDIRRIEQYDTLSAAATETRTQVETGTRPDGTPKTTEEKLYELAFIKFMSNRQDAMTTDERRAWGMYSTSGSIRRPRADKGYEQGKDSHGREVRTGFPQLTTRDVSWEDSEIRAALDVNSLSTAGGEPGIAGATGFTSGYMIPMGFWHNLQIALKAYGGILPYIQMIQTDSGQPMPWPTVSKIGRFGE
jgi:HK97 family phage major capsid protein